MRDSTKPDFLLSHARYRSHPAQDWVGGKKNRVPKSVIIAILHPVLSREGQREPIKPYLFTLHAQAGMTE